jgi:hypothetical protein
MLTLSAPVASRLAWRCAGAAGAACQSGGGPSASISPFSGAVPTWGVLARLLKADLGIEGVSGASGAR